MNLHALRELLMLHKACSDAVYLYAILGCIRSGRSVPAFEEHVQIPQRCCMLVYNVGKNIL